MTSDHSSSMGNYESKYFISHYHCTKTVDELFRCSDVLVYLTLWHVQTGSLASQGEACSTSLAVGLQDLWDGEERAHGSICF